MDVGPEFTGRTEVLLFVDSGDSQDLLLIVKRILNSFHFEMIDPLRGHGGASSPGPGMLDSLKVASLCDKTIVAKYAYKNHRNNVIIIQRFSKNLRTD